MKVPARLGDVINLGRGPDLTILEFDSIDVGCRDMMACGPAQHVRVSFEEIEGALLVVPNGGVLGCTPTPVRWPDGRVVNLRGTLVLGEKVQRVAGPTGKGR